MDRLHNPFGLNIVYHKKYYKQQLPQVALLDIISNTKYITEANMGNVYIPQLYRARGQSSLGLELGLELGLWLRNGGYLNRLPCTSAGLVVVWIRVRVREKWFTLTSTVHERRARFLHVDLRFQCN